MEAKIIIFEHSESISILEKKHYDVNAQKSDLAEHVNPHTSIESSKDSIIAGISI